METNPVPETAPDNVVPIKPPVAEKPAVIPGVPVFYADGTSLYLDEGQAVLGFVQRFAPCVDGSIDASPRTTLLVRLPHPLGRQTAEAMLAQLNQLEKAGAKRRGEMERQASLQAEAARKVAQLRQSEGNEQAAQTLEQAAKDLTGEAQS